MADADADGPSGKSAEDKVAEAGWAAFDAGRYSESFSHLHSALLTRAIRWFREEGVTFHRPPGETTPTDLIMGLAFAAQADVEGRGDDAPIKLRAAASLFAAIAELRVALEAPSPMTPEEMHEKLAELTIRSAKVGHADMFMTTIELGWLDKAAQYEIDRESRRKGAFATNAKRQDAREQALGEAIRISGTNQTLSNEELARRVVERTGLPTTIRTATEWMRSWRKAGYLPPIIIT